MTAPAPSTAWLELAAHRDALAGTRIEALFDADPGRTASLTLPYAGLAVDFSKQRVTDETLRLLQALARERDVPAAIERLFTGALVNPTEGRPALHTAVRGDEHVTVDGEDILPGIQRSRERLRTFATAVREGLWKGATGKPLRAVLSLGIGGSSLGPRVALEALAGQADGPKVRFAQNVDPADLDAALAGLDPATTLVVVASKTFTTQETMANAAAARRWLEHSLGPGAAERHVVAATSRPAEAIRFGLPECNVFPFGEWIGGRFSVWSSVGLPLAIAVGAPAFEHFLAGAHAADLEFRSAPPERNVPLLAALIGCWNRNVLGLAALAVLPYAERLANLPAYLQQLEMESNGKRVRADGSPVDGPTGPLVFGGVGTTGQHAYHQWLHQGTDPVASDFILVASPMGSRPEAHDALLAHALAQSEALMTGRATGDPHRDCPGDRPSTTIVLPRLDPASLGALLAFYEHRAFVQAAIWGTNPFDQFGVELGKAIAGRILPAVRGQPAEDVHPATRGLVGVLHKLARSD